MKLKKLAALVIAGAMLVSALPMTANAAYSTVKLYLNNAKTVVDGYSESTTHYLHENAGVYSVDNTADGALLKVTYPENLGENYTEEGGRLRYEAYFYETHTYNGADAAEEKNALEFRGGDLAIYIPDDVTITANGGDATTSDAGGGNRAKTMGIFLATYLADRPANELIIHGGNLVATAGAGDFSLVGNAAPREMKAGIAISTSLATYSALGCYAPSDQDTPASLVLDGTKVIADGNSVTQADARSYGVYTANGTITLKNGATLKAYGSTAAVSAASIVAPTGYKIIGEASTTCDAATKVAYNAADLANYKWIDVKVVSEDYVEPSEPEETKVTMTEAGTSEVVDGKKNVGFTATVAADTYNSVLMKVDGDAKVYGWALGTAMTLDAEAEVGIQVNNVPEAATIAVKLSTTVLN